MGCPNVLPLERGVKRDQPRVASSDAKPPQIGQGVIAGKT